MNINRITVAKTAAYVIAGIAAVSSYGHQVRLLSLADLDPLFGFVPSEWVTPVTVDSLAIVALMVRTSDTVTARTRRVALLPLILAGGLAVAANVALARNPIQVIVGVWTVMSYIVAEIFVARMERSQPPAAEPIRPRVITEQERAARKRAGYEQMTAKEKAAWTRSYQQRRQRTAPTSPGRVPVDAPSVREVAEIVR